MNPDREQQADTDLARLRRQIREQLASAQTIIVELRRELDRRNQENQDLIDEREEMRRRLARQQATRLEEIDEQRRKDLRDAERRDAIELSHGQETARLQRRCGALEQQLVREREINEESRLEIACLEEQVEQLQSTIDLLEAAADL